MMAAAIETTKPFGPALNELLRDTEFTTQTGNPNIAAFVDTLDGVHYETLRKAMAGERTPTPHIIEEVSRALRIKPDYFLEYRLHLAQRQFDPREVGMQAALDNLTAWASQQPSLKKKRRSR